MTTPTPSAPDVFGRRRALLWALGLALLVTWFTGAIPRWGQWFSEHAFYRAQVAAFFEGRLALSHDPEGVTHDLAWVDGGVQHVWGLGVPLWLAFWELVGRVVHVTPFPDRVAMIFGEALVLYGLLRAWLGPGSDRTVGSRGAFLITALLPGVITMMRGRLAVYEEAEAYAYGTSMLLLAGVLVMLRRPSTAKYLLLVTLAGFSGLMRPTVWFYGAAAAGVATVLYVQYRGGLRRALAVVLVAAALFTAGGGALYGTNYLRFGAGSEFGHRLNLEDLPGNIYATRFDYPFDHAPLPVAAKELAGGMFGRPELRSREGYHFYDPKLHAGQADLPRWREYYFTNYTWVYAPLSLVGLALIAACWLRVRRERPAGARDPDLARETRWLGVFALGGTLPLLAFYLRSPSLSSRYFLDVGPGVAVLVATTWRHAAAWLDGRGRRLGTLGFVAFFLWWGWSVLDGKALRAWHSPLRAGAAVVTTMELTHPLTVLRDLPDAYDLEDPDLRVYIGADQWECPCFLDVYDEDACDHAVFGLTPPDIMLVRAFDRRLLPLRMHTGDLGTLCTAGAARTGCDVDAPDAPAPDGVDDPTYAIETRWRGDTLYLNGTNWDLTTGAIAPATYLFVDAPGEIDVEVAPDRGLVTADWVPAVRAKVQLEELVLIDTESTARGVRFRFAAPTTAKYREGLQVIFLAFGGPEHIDEATSGYKLLHVGWHGGRTR